MVAWLIGNALPFVLIAVPLVLSPGPDSLVILRNALASGRSVGMAAVAGVQCGLLVHLTLAVIGISLFIVRFANLYAVVVLAGAAYLGWLGVQSFRQRGVMRLGQGKAVTIHNSALSAMLTNLLNPKVLVLFFSLLPGFVDPAAGLQVNLQLLLLVSILICINTFWQASLVIFCHAMSSWLLTPRINTILCRSCGIAMLVFAGLMLYEHSW